MSQPLKVALVRGVIGGAINAGSVFFASLAAGAGTTGSVNHVVLLIAGIAAGAAFFATLATRFAAEGLIDTQAAKLP